MLEHRVIALGFFDGVHLGHGSLLRQAVRTAQAQDAIPAAVTFDPPPHQQTAGQPIPLINSLADRIALMKDLYHIQDVIILPFHDKMRRMPWETFVRQVLIGRFGAAHLVAGHDFRFGYGGKGTAEGLAAFCREAGLGCHVMPQVTVDGAQVSSTHIRALLAAGDLGQANRFLGHPHVLTRRVERGKQLGSRMGFPTVNLTFPPGVLIPAHGVYAARVRLPQGTLHPAVVNIGLRPTVETAAQARAEGYILDYSGELYGEELHMEFFAYLRPEQRFADVDALARQIRQDAQTARELLAAGEK